MVCLKLFISSTVLVIYRYCFSMIWYYFHLLLFLLHCSLQCWFSTADNFGLLFSSSFGTTSDVFSCLFSSLSWRGEPIRYCFVMSSCTKWHLYLCPFSNFTDVVKFLLVGDFWFDRLFIVANFLASCNGGKWHSGCSSQYSFYTVCDILYAT